ncbi:alkaline phosphatase PhoX [Microbacterium sp.]|uniref:alkaline phosphatase PhoX n=1 Tax=Microbacterium sp. TaxID=51671 RepID=UPI0025FC9D68|nr:alkaline phosphatase PhoX [Microbacterium sp.]
MRTRIIAAAAICATALALVPAGTGHAADGQAADGHAADRLMGFDPIGGTPYSEATATWEQPFVIPEGYSQRMVADETVLDIYGGGVDDLTDMNTVNETGKQAGRYLYRTHEVDGNGALSVVDLKTGEAKVIAQDQGWRRLDGIRWTPWGTILFAEETAGGRLFEAFLDPKDPTKIVRVEARPEVGILRHEGIEALGNGVLFVIDELNGGSIFMFVPSKRSDLSDGQLYALKLTGLADDAQVWNAGTVGQKVGAFEWVALDMNQVVVDADAAANAVAATEFGRPEDVEVIGRTLYVANTSEDRVVAIDLISSVLSSFVQAGVNVPVENAEAGVTGFNNPDNLAQGPGGRLWVVEDNYLSDVWVARRDLNRDGAADSVAQFASLKDTGAEISGIYFGKDPKTLFLNVQHPDKELADGTWMITKR